MKILQYNCQSFKSNRDNIEYYLNNYDIDVCLLSEIFEFNENHNICKLINFNIVYKNRPDGYGGVAICLKKALKFKKIPYDSDYDIVILKTNNFNRNFVFASTYFPPSINKNDFENEVMQLLNFLDKFENIVLAGDFNARNSGGIPLTPPGANVYLI